MSGVVNVRLPPIANEQITTDISLVRNDFIKKVIHRKIDRLQVSSLNYIVICMIL